MKRTTYIYTIIVLAIAGVIASCGKDLRVYNGPNQVEFSPIVKSRSQGTVAVPGYDSVKVQVIGAQLSSAQTLSYNIDASSTAVAGTHYSIPNSGTFTLPANSSFGYIRINLVPGSIASSATTSQKTLVLNLTGNSALPASPNYSKYTLTITF